ncbi:MAG: glycosyltransferase, partial [Roseococcus sp.]
MIRETWILLDSSGFGGIESHVAELAAGLREAGRAPRVLLLQDHGPHPLSARLAAEGVPLEVLPGGFAALWRRLREGRPAVLHTHGYKANLLGRFAARLTGTRCVASFHAGERPPGLLALYDAADRWTSCLGPRIAVSRPILSRLPWGGELVPNFLALPPEPPVGTPLSVAFVGRLSPEKGPDLFAELSRLAPGPSYEVFGDGPMRAEVAAPGLILHGARPGMGEAWAGIGLLAITSRAEGLPLAVTISLAYSTGKMLQDKNLIRHLDACETMGNATDICTDKTGTLTENQMTVVEAWLGGVPFTFSTSRVGELAPPLTPPAAVPPILRDMLRDHLAVNSTASVIELAESNVSGGPATGAVAVREEVRGSKTEGAGLKLVAQLDPALSYTAIRAALSEHGRLIKQFAFSSDRKMMSTIAELPDGRVRVFTTGGSDMVLSRCTRMGRLDATGARLEPLALSESRVADIITRIITPMAQQSLRTIAVAYRDFPNRALVPQHKAESQLMMFGYYIWNNVRIDFQC